MKKIRKILLIILVLISVNLVFMPKKAEAYSVTVLDNVIEYQNNFENEGSSFWDNLGISMGDILGKFSWLNGLAWLIYISVAIIAFPKWVAPAIKAIVTGDKKSQHLSAVVIYFVYVIGGIIICLGLFPLIITEI